MSDKLVRRGVFDEDARRRFLNFYAEFGMFYKAAAAAGVSGQCVYDHLKEDEEFAAEYEEAKGRFRDRVEEEITRRAMEGVDEYVTCGKGLVYVESETEFETVMTEDGPKQRPKMVPLKQRRFSDTLLMFHARRHIPEYRDKQQIDVNHTGGVLVVPAGKSVEEWEAENQRPPAIEGQARVLKG